MPGARAAAWNVLGAFLFAAMNVLAHDVGARCGWRLVVLVRSLVSLAMVYALARRAGVPAPARFGRWVWIRSVAGALAQFLNFYALVSLPASAVLTVRNAAPIWMALASGWVLGEASPRGAWLGAVVGVTGVVLVEQPRVIAADPATLAALAASWLTAMAMLALSRCGPVDRRWVVAHLSAVTVVGVVGVGGATALGGLATSGGASLALCDLPEVLPGLAGVGVLGCLAQLAMTHAYRDGAAVSLGVVGLTQVLFALALDLWLGVRSLGPSQWLGTLLVLAPAATLALAGRRSPEPSPAGDPEPI